MPTKPRAPNSISVIQDSQVLSLEAILETNHLVVVILSILNGSQQLLDNANFRPLLHPLYQIFCPSPTIAHCGRSGMLFSSSGARNVAFSNFFVIVPAQVSTYVVQRFAI